MTDHFYLFQTQVDHIYKFGMTSRVLKLRIKNYSGLNKPKSKILSFTCDNGFVMEDAFKIFLQRNKISINKTLGKEFFNFAENIESLFNNFCNVKDSIVKTIDINKIQRNRHLKRKKCNKCKCWRTKQDFVRRDKIWNSCNICADFNKKYQQNKATKKTKCDRCRCWRTRNDFIRRNKKWKTCNMCADLDKKYKQKKNNLEKTDMKTNHPAEPTITLVDLWPHIKDSTNSEAVKNDPKIKYTVLWDSPKGLEEVECKYDEIPSSFKFRIPDSDTINDMIYD